MNQWHNIIYQKWWKIRQWSSRKSKYFYQLFHKSCWDCSLEFWIFKEIFEKFFINKKQWLFIIKKKFTKKKNHLSICGYNNIPTKILHLVQYQRSNIFRNISQYFEGSQSNANSQKASKLKVPNYRPISLLSDI